MDATLLASIADQLRAVATAQETFWTALHELENLTGEELSSTADYCSFAEADETDAQDSFLNCLGIYQEE